MMGPNQHLVALSQVSPVCPSKREGESRERNGSSG